MYEYYIPKEMPCRRRNGQSILRVHGPALVPLISLAAAPPCLRQCVAPLPIAAIV